MIISKHMKRNVVSIPATASVREAAAVFVKKHITASLWLKRGLPVMLVACTISSILYTILYNWF
jgi:CBS domain-containing protein